MMKTLSSSRRAYCVSLFAACDSSPRDALAGAKAYISKVGVILAKARYSAVEQYKIFGEAGLECIVE
jgi:hypothetical protein